jgi:hypothetical protein
VTFRLSEEEYATLLSACGVERNSVSALARRSVLEWTDSTLRPKVDGRLAQIDEKLDTLLQLLNTRSHAE